MKHVTDQIQAYLDGELPPAAVQRFGDHVQACPACRRELAARQALWDQVDRVAPVPTLPPLWPQLAGRLQQRESRPWSWSFRGLAVAATLAGLLLGWQVGGPASGPQTLVSTDAEDGYLESALPSLDQLWLQLDDLDAEAGS